MSVILDTSILIAHQKGDARVRRELRVLAKKFPLTPAITFINAFEYLVGISLLTKRKAPASQFLGNFDVINTTDKTAEIMASLRVKYEKLGIVIPLPDLIIASLAIENNMVLVTSDKDFKDVKELEVEFVT
jgi:predicted nucleic acid-binding protein